MVKEVDDIKEFEQLTAGDKVVCVDFHATWCGPCKVIAPLVKELEGQYPDMVFIKVDVDEADEIAQKCEVSAMPTFKFFKGGVQIDEMVGANKDKLKELVAKHGGQQQQQS